MVDATDGLFGDWCELNFPAGVPQEALALLRRDYGALQQLEDAATAGLSEALLGTRVNRATVFIPSLVAALEDFWRPRLRAFDGNAAPAEDVGDADRDSGTR